jgi:benzil reductase ((S)-benzoin forming)
VQLFIVTGASRGLGLALAQQLRAPGHRLLTLARRPEPSLADAKVEQWAVDLTDSTACAARLSTWLRGQQGDDYAGATLINNAGQLGHVGPIDAADPAALVAALRVNLESALLLTAAFLRETRAWPARRRVLNISSGAGRRPIAGWATYCASKAALDHASRVLAEDEKLLPNPAAIVSLAPGVIDTDMQGELRGADSAGFPSQEHFVEMKSSGQLASPDEGARRVLAYLARADFGTQPVADVRDPG